MDSMRATQVIRLILAGACLTLTSACYYAQAARGQLQVLRQREPIATVIGDPSTPAELSERLRLVQEARTFSVDELGLPDNGSYSSYADLGREYVVWNVFAAEEFSLSPKRWCYPIVGCVSYRGYFRQAAAESKAKKLAEDGYDVFFGGVSAYSTLGKFDDPVLSTMMKWDDVQLIATLFHELAHQVLYIKHDTGFNESFATAVEEFGIERFLQHKGLAKNYDVFLERKAFRRRLMLLINAARDDLRSYFAETIDPDEKRLLKEHRIEKLTADIRAELRRSGRDADGWLSRPFNNARLASFSLYEGHLPAFRSVLQTCHNDLPCFYAEARRISELDEAARDAYLGGL